MPSALQRLFGGIKLPRMSPFREMGAGGVGVWGGYIRNIERNPNWIGRQRYITSSEIVANVSIVAASTHYFLNAVSRPNWSVVPANDSPKASEFADFVDDVIFGLATPWPRVVRRACSYRFYGYSLQEWTATKLEDGRIGIQDIEPRPQHTIEQWVVDERGTVTGVWQKSPQTQALLGLPRSKLIYIVDDSLTDSPEGMGAFRHLAEPYSRLKQFLALEARAFERDLRGTPIGRAPITLIKEAVKAGSLSEGDGDKMIQGMKAFIEQQVKQADTGMLLDSMPYESEAADGRKMTGFPQWSMELLQGSANGLTELHAAIDRIQREMARIFGTEQLMLGEQAGSRALSQDKSKNLYLSANSVLTSIVEAMTIDLIDPIWSLNGFPDEMKPWFKAEDVTPREVGEITAALREMATAGAVLAPDDPIIDDVRDLLGVSRQPEREEDEMDAMVRSAMGLPSPEEEEMAAAGATGGLSIALDDPRGDEVLAEIEKAFDESKIRRVRAGPGGGQFTNKPKSGAASSGQGSIPAEYLLRVEVEPDVWITLDRRKLGGKTPREAAIEQAVKDGKMEPPAPKDDAGQPLSEDEPYDYVPQDDEEEEEEVPTQKPKPAPKDTGPRNQGTVKLGNNRVVKVVASDKNRKSVEALLTNVSAKMRDQLSLTNMEVFDTADQAHDAIVKFIKSKGHELPPQMSTPGAVARGVYDPNTRSMFVSMHDLDGVRTYDTFFHELAHSAERKSGIVQEWSRNFPGGGSEEMADAFAAQAQMKTRNKSSKEYTLFKKAGWLE